ncbi:MAG: hypothetical protein ACK4EY_14515 [Flavipsychrobacter sp.]
MNELQIKLKPSQLRALHSSFDFLIKHYEVLNEHELLLLHHAIDFREVLDKLLQKKQKQYTFKLVDVTALAFAQIWHTDYKLLKELERNVVFSINEQIDKYRKQLKSRIYYETV